MRVLLYRADPIAEMPLPWGGRYPSRIGYWVRLPGRRILALHVRRPR